MDHERVYTVMLIEDPHEGGYTVTVPALPGCITEGDTFEEAMANAREAIEVHLEALAASGETAPDDARPLVERVTVSLETS